MNSVMSAALIALFAYLCGSIPFCWLMGRVIFGVDLRHEGDGNVGAGNLMRYSRVAGFLGLGLDIGKGALPVFVALQLGAGDAEAVLAGGVAVAGHIWPLWLGFDGGRGAASALGVALPVYVSSMALLLAAGTLVVVLTRNTVLGLLLVMPATVLLGATVYGGGWPLAFLVALFISVGLKDFSDRARRRHGLAPVPGESR